MTDHVELRRGTLADLPALWVSVRLTQRHGFRPTWSYLSRFTGR